jgi:hypothetical protein
MARPVNIREERAISTFRLGSSAVLCMAIVLVKLGTGRGMVRQRRVTEYTRGFIRYRARSDWRLPVVCVQWAERRIGYRFCRQTPKTKQWNRSEAGDGNDRM